jgi:hypothetical protein
VFWESNPTNIESPVLRGNTALLTDLPENLERSKKAGFSMGKG